MMTGVGAQPEEIVKGFERHLRALPNVRAAFVTLSALDPRQLTLWTILEDHDEATETALVEFESQIEQEVGPETSLRFRLLYRRGRHLGSLIPHDARLLKSA